jgi:hypothetical protein
MLLVPLVNATAPDLLYRLRDRRLANPDRSSIWVEYHGAHRRR